MGPRLQRWITEAERRVAEVQKVVNQALAR